MMGRGLGGLLYGTWLEAQRGKQEEQTSGLRRMAGTGKLVEKMVKAVSVRPADAAWVPDGLHVGFFSLEEL